MISIGTPLVDATGETRGSPARQAWGGALALGSLGVVATSAFYLLSPAEAALPVLPLDLAAALTGAQHGAATMRAAGTFGIMSDVVVAAAAFALGAAEIARRGPAATALGWLAVAVSALIFVSVDAIVGFVLAPLAAHPQEPGSFLGFKLFFDCLFALGTLAFASGSALIFLPQLTRPRIAAAQRLFPAAIAVPAGLAAIVGTAAGLASLLGFDSHQAMGASIALGSVLFAFAGARLARTGD